ncbi:Pyruvate/Phosphoenolpyruvate kinase-like domain-containing protein [Mycena latifolia]|nr:Pyruvate/Phosphoenolpyruvate kinase-like domain-containing protein [Mycena latifolia]
MASHALLNALKANKPAFGVWLSNTGFVHARTVAQASPKLLWVAVDCEHGLTAQRTGLTETIAGIFAAGPGAPSAFARINLALDAGAQGVLVPMVSTVAKATEVVTDSRFPSQGRRGFGNPFTYAGWGLSAAEYLAVANSAVVVMVQIETPEGLANVKDIAQVDGVDVLFIGPYDLSISLGYLAPSPDPHPEVEKAIQHIRRVVHDAGKKCAIFCISGSQAARRAEEGFDMVSQQYSIWSFEVWFAEALAVLRRSM